MRISNPKLFNGQTLATKQQISAWLAGTTDNSFGTLSIPASNVKYGTDSNVSAQIEAIYAKLGLDNTGTDSFDLNNIITGLSNIKSNITVSEGTYNYIVSGDAVATNLVALDTNLKTVSGDLDIAEGEIDAIQAQLAGLPSATVVKYVEGVSGNLQGAIEAVGLGADIEITPVVSGDYAMVYTITQGGAEVGTINIPKDQFLKGAEIVEGTYEDGVFTPITEGTPSKKYIHFTFEIEVQEKHIYLDIQDLCDVYTGGNGITVAANNTIAVNANTAKAIEVSAEGVAVKVDGKTIVFTENGALSAVIPVQSVSGGIGIDESSTSGNVILNLKPATDAELGGVKSGDYISVDTEGKVVVKKVEHALTAFGKAYDGSAVVTISGKTDTAKYITYSQEAGVFTVGAQGLDVAANGSYVLSGNTVAENLTALDTAVGELSGKFEDIDHATLTIGSKTYDTSTDVTVTIADLVGLGTLTDVVSGNAGIAVSEKADGKVSVSAVVKEGDLHLGIGETGIETSGLVTAAGNIISADTTVATNLEALDAEIGDLVSGAYISGDVVASDLKALDTQVKANTDAIAANTGAIRTAMQIVSVPLTAAVGTVEFDGAMCYSYAAPDETAYILQVTSGGTAVCADINEKTVYVDSTGLAAAPALSALIATPVVITTTSAE